MTAVRHCGTRSPLVLIPSSLLALFFIFLITAWKVGLGNGIPPSWIWIFLHFSIFFMYWGWKIRLKKRPEKEISDSEIQMVSLFDFSYLNIWMYRFDILSKYLKIKIWTVYHLNNNVRFQFSFNYRFCIQTKYLKIRVQKKQMLHTSKYDLFLFQWFGVTWIPRNNKNIKK